MLKRILLIFLFIVSSLFIFNNELHSQNILKSKFVDAEYYFLFDEYSKALPMYLSILQKDSNNANINYRIALCYMNLVGQKYKAIPYLEKAVKDITYTYKEGSYKEIRAPFEAFLYLGDAYRINEDIEKAIEAYKKFQSLLKPDDVFFQQIVTRQIKSCENAQEMFFSPVEVEESNLGSQINSTFYEYNPCVSSTDDLMFFTMSKNTELILMTKSENGVWEKPKNITNVVKSVDGNCKTVSLSHDGKFLFFSDDNADNKGDLYVSKVNKGKVQPMDNLNKNINSRYSETHACLSPDGKILYFTSDRKDGFGGLDIYKSKKKDGDWGEAENLGSTINTPFNEETPFLTEDGKSLYFSSEGHNSIGGFDFFVSSMLEDGNWSVPLNLGYPISTTDDDLFYNPIANGEKAYTYRTKNYGDALSDIFKITPSITKQPENVVFKGEISFQDNQTDNALNSKIILINSGTKDTFNIFKPDTATLEYNFSVPLTNYDIIFETKNYQSVNEKFVVPNLLIRVEVNYNIEFVPLVLASNNIKADSIKTINNSVSDSIKNVESNITKNDVVVNENKNDSIKLTNVVKQDSIKNVESNITKNDIVVNENKNDSIKLTNVVKQDSIKNIESNITKNDVVVNENKNNDVKNTEKNNTENVNNNNKGLYVIKSVYFDFSSSSLNAESKSEIEKLYLLMKANSQLQIELVGHTDSKGNPEFNKILSEKRAKSVVSYLKSKGISSNKIKTIGVGEDQSVAINENPDGTDNPDGRKLNRRVDINILNAGNENVVVENIYVPDNLKVDESTEYFVLLKESNKLLSSSDFAKYGSSFSNPSVRQLNGKYYYFTGKFAKKPNAVSLLNEAIDNGFAEAKILNTHELNRYQPVSNEKSNNDIVNNTSSFASTDNYTVQIKALSKNIPPSEFSGLTGISVTECTDGFYRYTIGDFSDYDAARLQKSKVIEAGFPDAFIIKVAQLKSKSGKLKLEPQTNNNSQNSDVNSNSSSKFTIQLKALNSPLSKDYFKDLEGVKETYCADGFIRYTLGEYNNYNVAAFDLAKIKEQGFNDAYVVDFSNYKPIEKQSFQVNTSATFTIQIKASANAVDKSEFKGLEPVKEFIGTDGFHRYAYGEFPNYASAKAEWEKIITNGFPDAFIVNIEAYKNK
ncbi:MAG: hypothetical protein A2046_05515 [Bacteroidetes bacterium GWA2_30_7]|nr:MAG: hypothetical protein A2046_05515 [Bacteroidetes bacterium GWA2_30_7]